MVMETQKDKFESALTVWLGNAQQVIEDGKALKIRQGA